MNHTVRSAEFRNGRGQQRRACGAVVFGIAGIVAATSAHALRLNRRPASRERAGERAGIRDVRGWLKAHPEDLAACRRVVLVRDANRAARDFLAGAGRAVSAAEIAALADGSTTFAFETPVGRRFVHVQLSVMPSAVADWSRVIEDLLGVR